MSATDDLLIANQEYARTFDRGGLPMPPARHLAIVTCMDARILRSRAFGLQEGDAHVIRNAGGRARDALRSLIISQRLLGTRGVAAVHHTDCGMLTFSNRELRAKVQEDLGQDTGEFDFLPFTESRAACGRTSNSSRRRSCSIRRRCFGDSCYDVRSGRLTEVRQEVEAAG
jgi:carbonic anhydrase